jgi:hypothetical protein
VSDGEVGLFSPGGLCSGLFLLSRRCHLKLLLCSFEPEQFEQIMRGSDQLPLNVNLF